MEFKLQVRVSDYLLSDKCVFLWRTPFKIRNEFGLVKLLKRPIPEFGIYLKEAMNSD